MKKLLVTLSVLISTMAFAQDKNAKATIEVDGICGMCKHRIEKACLTSKGVKSAIWNVETHKLKLIYNARKTNVETIQKTLASVGHDTEAFKAEDEVYNNIDPCCKYRDEEVVKDHQ